MHQNSGMAVHINTSSLSFCWTCTPHLPDGETHLTQHQQNLTSVVAVRACHIDKWPGILCLLVYFQQQWDCVIFPFFKFSRAFIKQVFPVFASSRKKKSKQFMDVLHTHLYYLIQCVLDLTVTVGANTIVTLRASVFSVCSTAVGNT